jgi:hypothetical protein
VPNLGIECSSSYGSFCDVPREIVRLPNAASRDAGKYWRNLPPLSNVTQHPAASNSCAERRGTVPCEHLKENIAPLDD